MANYWYDHIHLISLDPLKTAQFYERMFNAKRVGIRELGDGRTSVELDLNGTRLLVINQQPPQSVGGPDETAPSPPGAGYGLEHFGIVTDNIEAAAKELKAAGVEFVQDITEARPGFKYSFLLGPENVLIELVERSS